MVSVPDPLCDRRASASPRERIREAMMSLVVEHGYEGTTIAAVVARARVDRADFDRQFSGKQDCCLWIYVDNNELFDRHVQAAYAAHGEWRDSLRAAAYTAADYLAARPREVRFNTVAMLSAGDMIAAQRDVYLQRLVDLVDAGRQQLDDPGSISRGVAESAVGAIFERLLRDVHLGDSAVRARDIVPELMYLVVRPYLGHEVAREELRIPPPDDLSGRDG